MDSYGTRRVLEPKFVLPTSAWMLDNQRSLYPGEIRMAVKRIQLERTNFKQICTEANYNEEKIRQKVVDIVIHRGKFHNPITDTGGIAYGVIEQIGIACAERGLSVGDKVIANASLASIPLYIESIGEIDYTYNQIEVTGYAILKDSINLVKVTEKDPVNLLMYIFDESGTVYRLSKIVHNENRFLIVGNNMITSIIYGYVIRRMSGIKAEIVCILDKKTEVKVRGAELDRLISYVFNQVHFMDILKPVECIERLEYDSYFDISVNCAEIPGAETINVLATKDKGTVIFANLINNLNIAVYITEAVSKSLNILGAEGYIEDYDKLDIELAKELSSSFENIETIRSRRNEIETQTRPTLYNKVISEQALLEDFVSVSPSMEKVLEDLLKVSKYDCNVIIFGDTGVGKEKAANMIQRNSDRKMQPFIKINCGAISPSLIESEFFGYEKGSFTGANAGGKKGYFEVANNGIMFLDEIGEMPLDMQAKFLRVIQDGEFFRVGGTTPIKTNVRIISATNRDLEEMIEEGSFRRDLYYRLNVVPIRIPPLNERKEDIPSLVGHFLSEYGETFGKKIGIDDSAVDYLMNLSWPGNIRELENVVQRLIIAAKGENITLMDVMKETHNELFENSFERMEELEKEDGPEINLEETVNEYEKSLIKYALKKYGSTRKAAKAIGISQTQLVRKKTKYDL